jgi:parallel beta-helix repeat protein
MTTEANAGFCRALRKLNSLGLTALDASNIQAKVMLFQARQYSLTSSREVAFKAAGEVQLTGLSDFVIDASLLLTTAGVHNLVLRDCHRFRLSGDATRCVAVSKERDEKRLILLKGCSEFDVENLHIKGGRNALTLERCRSFQLQDLTIGDTEGYGVTLLHSTAGALIGCQFSSCLAAGINIVGNCYGLRMHKCTVERSRGSFNWDAGINVMHCSPAVDLEAVPEASHEALDLTAKVATPHLIWMDHCEVSGCVAQGIYLEGAAQVLIDHCSIHDNNKEGLCLDWGTGYSHVSHCLISRNGERAHYTDERCRIDFLPPEYRDSENRHYCQLPGISIDNGYGNLIEYNTISSNYGGGIKIIRSAFDNRISHNILTANHSYHNESIPNNPYHVSEIKLLAMGTGYQEFDSVQQYLDFLEPAGNQIIGNRVLSGRLNPESQFACWNLAVAKRTNTIEI